MNDAAIRKRFEEYRDRLLDECQYFVACAHISKRFSEQQIKTPKMFNTAPCFWEISMKSIFVSIVLWGEKLFRDHAKSDGIDLWKFLRFVESNRTTLFPVPIVDDEDEWSVTPADIRKHEERLKHLDGVKELERLRHKYYAHFDSDYFLDRKSLWDGAGINFAALENMGNVAQEVLLHYSLAYDGVGFNVEYTNVDDINGLFDLIERYFERK